MKRLLILVDKIGIKKEAFAEHMAKELVGQADVVLARFSDLVFDVNGKEFDIKIDGTGLTIKDFHLVYFRRAGDKFFSWAGTLGVCLDNLGIRFADTTFKQVGAAGDKFTSYMRLSLAGLPVMPSFYCGCSKIEEKADEIISKFGTPLVAKQLSSQRGRGVVLVRNKPELLAILKDFPDKSFMFQKYYESDEEYRILVLRDTIGAFERKIRTDPNEFRCNVALGAREEFIDVNKIPEKMKQVAIEAAKVLEIEIAGVDILIDKAGRMWLLEVNRGPGLTYDPKVSPELDNLARFFKKELQSL